MSYRGRPPKCHPGKLHYSFGLCRSCYTKQYRSKNPDKYRTERERQKTYTWQHRQNKKQLIREFKEGKPCMDCGVMHPYYIMDFDHVRGKKLFNLGSTHGLVSREKILAEIEKCDLVCANCHRIRTHQRKTH